ncbi:unnamed protein product [Ceutorhynchus assimilis]|uniref:Uncharacterized protein n=1 Tax=Ceutorhynchus assimilis TaxID=467358 RepID=A0A9P0GP64_9CUCU|nr:unnamed protein product [Ceutorhynchus assimilis]
MLNNQRPFKSRFFSFLITFFLFVLFFLLLNAIQTVKVTKVNNIIVENVNSRLPGEYLKEIMPTSSEDGYCKLNFRLPAQLFYSKDAISGSPEFEENSPYHTLHDVIEGRIDQDQPEVTYATHLTKEFVLYISEVVRYWEGPVSIAAYVADAEDVKLILEHMLHFCYCIPEMSRVSLHLVFKKDFQLNFTSTRTIAPANCDILNLEQLNSGPDSDISYFAEEKSPSNNNWYPINVCRNVARQASYTEYVLVCDIELMPSENLASRFLEMTDTFSCLESSCEKRVFVVPVFEVESTENIPRTKAQLLDLIVSKKAVYFHQFTCTHCQKFPGLEQWKTTDPGDAITVRDVYSIHFIFNQNKISLF